MGMGMGAGGGPYMANQDNAWIKWNKFNGLRICIIVMFIVVLIALAFLIYLAVTDTEYRTNNPPAATDTNNIDNENYQAINLAALIFGCAGVVLILATVILTRQGRYLINFQQPVGSMQTSNVQYYTQQQGNNQSAGGKTPYSTTR
jgi:hypothetical protein